MEKQKTEMKQKLEMETGNETETGNENWKWKLETEMQTKDAQSLVQYFLRSVLSHYSSILSNRYGTGFMSCALPLLLYCAS